MEIGNGTLQTHYVAILEVKGSSGSLRAGSFFLGGGGGGGGIKLGKKEWGRERENEPARKPLYSGINP